MYLRESFDEINRYVSPHPGRHGQRLEQAGRVQGLGLVALAGGAGPHIIADELTILLDVEICPEALKCLLYALMPCRMGELEHFWQQGRGQGYEDTVVVQEQTVPYAPRLAAVASRSAPSSGEAAISWRSSSNRRKDGLEMAMSSMDVGPGTAPAQPAPSTTLSPSRRERASATMFSLPDDIPP